MVLKQEQITFLVETYLQCKSYKSTLREFEKRFGRKNKPCTKTISNLVKKFQETGSVQDLPRKRISTVLTATMRSKIMENVKNSPTKSLRKRAQRFGTSHATIHRAMKESGLRFYRGRTAPELKRVDLQKRLTLYNWFLNTLDENSEIEIIFTDKRWFEITGFRNRQNDGQWAFDRPNLVKKRPLHPDRIGVWCGISRKGIFGPIFFSGTITRTRYTEILDQFFLKLRGKDISNVFF
jgi:hypothetical protein